MKHNEGKNLQEFAAAFGNDIPASCSLPDSLYDAFSRAVAARSSVFRPGAGLVAGVRPVPPLAVKDLRFSRSVFGSLATSTLLSALSLERLAATILFSAIRPWCTACKSAVQALPSDSVPVLPTSGVLAISVVGGVDVDLPLSEWCGLLGVERAVVSERIVHVSDLNDDAAVGEPILRVFSARERELVPAEIERWFLSSGNELRILHADGRDAHVRELALLSRSVRCEQCHTALAIPTATDLTALPDCSRCQGHGWIPSEGSRYVACRDCDGYGSHDETTLAFTGKIQLRHVSLVTCGELGALAAENRAALSETEQRILSIVIDSPFKDYPIGTPLDTLSCGERTHLTVLSARISGLSNALFLFDRALTGNVSTSAVASDEARLCAVEPEWIAVSAPSVTPASEALRVVACDSGPLHDVEFSLPFGASCAIVGEAGAGKTMLLNEIVSRFKKRRKVAHTSSFGSLTNCVVIVGNADGDQTVLELMGLEDVVADEASRTQGAKRAGLRKADFVVGQSGQRCRQCEAGQSDADGAEVCGSCFGTRLSEAVLNVSLGPGTFGALLTAPLAQAHSMLWMSDIATAVLGQLPVEEQAQLTLATRVHQISPSHAAFLRVCGRVARLLEEGRSRRTQSVDASTALLIVDSVFGLTTSRQQRVFALLEQALKAGATIIAAGVPKALEKWFGSVIELQAHARPVEQRISTSFFDSRYSRCSIASRAR